MSKFACILKQLRLEHSITQKELASVLNVSQNAIFNWENEKREPPIDTIIKIAEYFNVSVDYLMGTNTDTPIQPSTKLAQRDKNDIKKKVDSIMESLDSANAEVLYYDGIEVQLSDETKELLRNALTIAMQAVKIENKEKYNPHKRNN